MSESARPRLVIDGEAFDIVEWFPPPLPAACRLPSRAEIAGLIAGTVELEGPYDPSETWIEVRLRPLENGK